MCSCFAMYIEAVPNRNSPPAILLRESYREGGKVRKRTLCNLSDWPTAFIEGLRGVLKGGTVGMAHASASGADAVRRHRQGSRPSIARKRGGAGAAFTGRSSEADNRTGPRTGCRSTVSNH